MLQYDSIEVPIDKSRNVKEGDSFRKCMELIRERAEKGWRLSQILTRPNEKFGLMSARAYEIILEREEADVSSTESQK